MGRQLADNAAFLIADIGGTNTRLALGKANGELSQLRTCANDDVEDLSALLLEAADAMGRPREAVIAVAGRVEGGDFRFTNRDWTISQSALQATLGLERLMLVNDFAAMAHSIPALRAADLQPVGAGDADARGNILVCGPGTGFGVSVLVRGGRDAVAIATEAGHMRLGAVNEQEADIFARVAPSGTLSVEDMLSGRGLVALHEAKGNERLSSDAIIAGADKKDAAARATVADFLGVFGRIVGDLALAFDARGGIYIGGGVGRALAPFYGSPSFRRPFEEHPPYRDQLRSIPIHVILHPYPGLIGALQIARERFGGAI
jgi:glucokinase